MTYDVISFDVMTHDFITYDVMTSWYMMLWQMMLWDKMSWHMISWHMTCHNKYQITPGLYESRTLKCLFTFTQNTTLNQTWERLAFFHRQIFGGLKFPQNGMICDLINFHNTSLAAKGALANRLQRLQNPKWPPEGPKMADGSGKVSTPRFLGVLSNFC